MEIINKKLSTSFVKAQITDNIVKVYDNNNTIKLQNKTAQQTLSSSYSEIITIKYDNKLVAPIIKNSDV